MSAVPGRGASAPDLEAPHRGAWLWLAYCAFVIYGSLVPLDFRMLPLATAWRAFANAPMLDLGIESRADWIANGILYIPVGFLSVSALCSKSIGFGRLSAAFIAAVFSLALAIAVEFTQLFFPPRTVSLNDLLAETIGAAAGILLAARWGRWFRVLATSARAHTGALKSHLLEAYAVGFLALSLFPYDFLLSWTEVEQKFASNRLGWLFANALTAENWIIAVLVRPLAEMAAALPVGVLVARWLGSGRDCSLQRALGAGLLLGAAIECAQFFIASGYTQGVSVLTRSAAFGLGALAWNARARLGLPALGSMIRRSGLIIGPAYLLGLAAVSGLLRGQWQISHMPTAIADLHFMPFYYHYFTTEAKALNSLVGVAAMYVPVGVLCWAFGAGSRTALVLAGLLALGIEACKTMVPTLRADPTNLLVGAGAAWLAVQLLARVAGTGTARIRPLSATAAHPQARVQMDRDIASVAPAMPAALWPPLRLTPFASLPLAVKVAMAITLAAVLAWLTDFPTQPWLLGALYALCATAIWRQPAWIFAIVPAALPMLDLAHWSGRFYLDEFDVLVAVGLVIGFARVPATKRRIRDPALTAALLLLGAAYAIGTARGLWPPNWPDANAFNNYFSPYEALRIGKGALWATLLWWLWRRLAARSRAPVTLLAGGLAAGLAWSATAILIERLAFSTLFDFTRDYRVTGPFSQMHTGGAYIECFLTVATPFLLLLLLRTRSMLLRTAGTACLVVTVYALMVTFSRGGYAAFAIAVCLCLAGFQLGAGKLKKTLPVAALLGALVAAIALPILFSPYAQQRIAGTAADVKVREAHWADALDMMATDPLTRMLGMGLGRFPETHYWKSTEIARSANYRLQHDGDNLFLRVGAGRAMYIDQIVDFDAGSSHVLSARVRAPIAGASLTVSICRKWLYSSADCVGRELKAGGAPNTWQSLSASFPPDKTLRAWPIKFSIHSPAGPAAIDIDDVALTGAAGHNLLANGDFSRQLDHWFFSNDEHLNWHVKNLPLALLFDLGALGLGAATLLTLLGMWRAGLGWLRGEAFSGALFAALSGFLIVGMIDSLIDTPRFLLLFLFLTLLACETRPKSPPDEQP